MAQREQPQRSLVISASRTKDIVRWSPTVLADVLMGRRPCRFGLSGRPGPLDLNAIHTLVLWTKDPIAIACCVTLRDALSELVRSGGQVYLQLTATGFGGTFVEHGVPTLEALHEHLVEVRHTGLVAANAIKLRYDPLLSVAGGPAVLSNLRPAVFTRVLDLFLPFGIEDVVTSYVDVESYPKVLRRMEGRLGLRLDPVPADGLWGFVQWMADECAARGARFDTCAAPLMPFAREGCISGTRLNALIVERDGPDAPRCTTQRHNEHTKGGQRPDCRCTYARDIGHSRGFTTCYTHGSGCLYCYSHRESLGPRLLPAVQQEIAEFTRDPAGFAALPGHEHYRLLTQLE